VKSVLRVLPIPPATVTGGEILYRGRDVLKMRRHALHILRRQELTAIFQDPLQSLNPVFTVGSQLRDIVRDSMHTRRGLCRAERSSARIQALGGRSRIRASCQLRSIVENAPARHCRGLVDDRAAPSTSRRQLDVRSRSDPSQARSARQKGSSVLDHPLDGRGRKNNALHHVRRIGETPTRQLLASPKTRTRKG
jgi:ABC-type dipeptide/oligopeptide/nickel transport system ATPase component